MTKRLLIIAVATIIALPAFAVWQYVSDQEDASINDREEAMEEQNESVASPNEGSISTGAIIDDANESSTGDMLIEDDSDESGEADKEAAVKKGIYAAYSDDILGSGEKKVLFFYAAWCPFCVRDDSLLKVAYGTMDIPLSTYKVDYDTETELKSRYGVVTQHTFVLVDGRGNKITSAINPGVDDLKGLLQ